MMRILPVVAAGLLALASGCGRSGQLEWAASYEDALDAAKRRDAVVMVDFHSDT